MANKEIFSQLSATNVRSEGLNFLVITNTGKEFIHMGRTQSRDAKGYIVPSKQE